MKSKFEWLVFLAVLSFSTFFAAAEEPPIPPSAWEQHPEGVALALVLTSGTDGGLQVSYLRLYVKNTSDTAKYLVTQSHGVAAQFFYVGANGNQVILGNHDHPGHPEKDLIESNQRLRVILPGKIRSTGTEVTADEVALMKTQTVRCKIYINDPTTKQDVPITGAPQLLTP